MNGDISVVSLNLLVTLFSLAASISPIQSDPARLPASEFTYNTDWVLKQILIAALKWAVERC